MKKEQQSAIQNAVDVQKTDKKRRYLSVKDIDTKTMDDIKGMFGMWKEADHCDKDSR